MNRITRRWASANGEESRRRRGQKGASMVEFAVVLPLFLIMVFGIMEAGWLFAQLTETRNAAREGARLAVVDFGDATAIASETCTRSSFTTGGGSVQVETFGDMSEPINDPTASVSVTVAKNYTALTGLLDPFFGGTSLDSTVTMRIERPITNLSDDTLYAAVGCP